jgi:hypothetical protein
LLVGVPTSGERVVRQPAARFLDGRGGWFTVSWFVQVKYSGRVPAQAPDGWVTVAVSEDMRDAARNAAFVYRVREHPDDSYPDQLRIRSEEQLHDSGGADAVLDALASLRAFGQLTARETRFTG